MDICHVEEEDFARRKYMSVTFDSPPIRDTDDVVCAMAEVMRSTEYHQGVFADSMRRIVGSLFKEYKDTKDLWRIANETLLNAITNNVQEDQMEKMRGKIDSL